MSYIMIENDTELPLWGVRVLGMTKKNDSQIGTFGTGLKEAVVLLLRMKKNIIIFSGTNRVEFDVLEQESGVPEVHYRMSEKRGDFDKDIWHPMGISPDFGKADWNSPWQVFREIFCNGLDEGGLYHDVVGAIEGKKGKTRVFIESDMVLLAEYGQMEKKLLMLGKRDILYSVDCGVDYYDGGGEDDVNVYNKGVWVKNLGEEGKFDYDISGLQLTESRTADTYSIRNEIRKSFIEAPVELAIKLIREGEKFENGLIDECRTLGGNWKIAFETVWGDKACACIAFPDIVAKVKSKGYLPVIVTSARLDAYISAGILTYLDVLSGSDKEKMHIVRGKSDKFDKIWRMLKRYNFENKRKPQVVIFVEPDDTNYARLGMVKDGIVYLNRDVLGSELEKKTCIEEIGHYLSGCTDASIGFQNWLIAALSVSMRM